VFKDLMPIFVFGGILAAIWAVLSWISQRNSQARKRRGMEDGDVEDGR
jgi:hypothetical protein